MIPCPVTNCPRPSRGDVSRCDYHERRRLARQRCNERKRARCTEEAQQGPRCQQRYGRGVCGARLEHTTDAIGRVLTRCPACERHRAGLCLDCPATIPSKQALRCRRCAARRGRESRARWHKAHKGKLKVLAWRRYRRAKRDPVFVEKRRTYNREYQRGDWWREYQREWARKNRAAKRAGAGRAAA